jgi:hypothetical protein
MFLTAAIGAVVETNVPEILREAGPNVSVTLVANFASRR